MSPPPYSNTDPSTDCRVAGPAPRAVPMVAPGIATAATISHPSRHPVGARSPHAGGLSDRSRGLSFRPDERILLLIVQHVAHPERREILVRQDVLLPVEGRPVRHVRAGHRP